MAQSTVLAVGAGLIVAGLATWAKIGTANPGMEWVIGGVVAIIVGWATKNIKM